VKTDRKREKEKVKRQEEKTFGKETEKKDIQKK